MHSNPTAVEVAGKLLFDIKQDHAAPRDWAERLGKVVQLIHEERDGGNLLAFRAGHKAGIETCSTGTFDIPVAFKFEMWMEE